MSQSDPPRNDRPLAGVRVVITRAPHQAGPTRAAFEARGARVELLPLLAVVAPDDPVPLRRALTPPLTWDWIAFTSTNAVAAVLDTLARTANVAGTAATEALAPVRLAAVGDATRRALEERGLEVDLTAETARAEGLAAALARRLAQRPGPGEGDPDAPRLLLPQADDARPVLERELVAAGFRVERVDAYAKALPPEAPARAEELFADGPLGWVVFTSPSTARRFAGLLGGPGSAGWERRRATLRAASIGPVTSDALRRLGVEPAAEAETPGSEPLARAVARAVSRAGEPG